MAKEQYAECRKKHSFLINPERKILNVFIGAGTGNSYENFAEKVHKNYKGYSAKNANQYLGSKKALMKHYQQKAILLDNVSIYLRTIRTRRFQSILLC